MSTGLTSRQATILDFIETYQLKNGYSPKIAEIQEAFEIKSVNGVIKHLRALEKKGFIKRDNTARGIALFDKVRQKLDSTMLQVPLFGNIPAGNPQDLSDYIEGYIPFDVSFLGTKNDIYALTVRGESMIDAGIFEGDTVIVERTQGFPGDIVVGLVDGENTLKRLMKEPSGVMYLKAENAQYPDIHAIHELEIQGVVRYLIRKF
ncbi:MAG: transcriptional repressor LexA [Candidatus Gracilibacteria bacterium]